VLAVNEKMCQMYGVTAEEARTLTANDLSANEPPYTHETALEWIAKAATGVPQLFEWRARDRAGRVFWVEVSLRCINLSVKERVLAMVHDITDRKRAEQALAEEFSQVTELSKQLQAENISLRKEISLEVIPNEIIGRSEAIRSLFFNIEQVARTNTTVLILGETGTGKDLVARAIHSMSLRKEKPLINVNCTTLQPTLIESELFGHERGAFTGATGRHLGRFELANGGTLFLDEIGDLPLELQAKLLRVLQEGEFERLGGAKTIKVNVRVVAATNRNLPMEVEKGLFREDLWYRLNVFPITVPPLRERKEDIPLLVEAFVRKFSKELGKTIEEVTSATIRALQNYLWPGNVRELANVIERAVINTDGPVLRLAGPLNGSHAGDLPFARQTLEHVERQYILRVLKETGWRIEGPKGAARILGLNPSTLRTRMAKLSIKKE
jgi:chemotaxis protein methyltransferase CheR